MEYIESTGTQYIDTGIAPENSLISIYFDIQYTDISTENYFVGCGHGWSYPGYGIAVGLYKNQWCTLLPGTAWKTFAPASENRIQANWTIDGNNGMATLSGDLSYSYTSLSHFGNNLSWRDDTICLVGLPNILRRAKIKLYGAKIRLSNNLVFNGIPALRKSDNVVGMYDTVTNTFYTNSGTGSFIAGPVVDTCENPLTIMGTEICAENTQPSGTYLVARQNGNKYYINLSEEENPNNPKPITNESNNVLRIKIGNTIYNAHDGSVE